MEKKDKCAVCGLEFKVTNEAANPSANPSESPAGANEQLGAKLPSARVEALCPYCENPNEISWPVGMNFVVRPAK